MNQKVVPPEALGVAATLPMPTGTVVSFGHATKELAPNFLFGGNPARLIWLSDKGVEALDELRLGPACSPAGANLARRLTDAGLAHPLPHPVDRTPSVTFVVPARNCSRHLDDCLRSLDAGKDVVVVDDHSADAAGIEQVCIAHGARLIRRSGSGGPAAARNTGAAAARTDLVAFVDSDCVVPDGWLADLVGHFEDPLVAGVAPRIVSATSSGLPSLLDMGQRPSRVDPRAAVPYVPTAALVVRRDALGDGFDEELRYGEDVDLVWRLAASGWRVRYEPSVLVAHRDPRSCVGRLQKRFRYGTSVGPLAVRHPGNLSHLSLQPLPAITAIALLARRPRLAGASHLAGTLLQNRRLKGANVRWPDLVGPTANGLYRTWLAIGRWCGWFAWPILAILLKRWRQSGWWRRAALLSLIVGPPVTQVFGEHPPRHVLAALGEEVAYGVGVAVGCVRVRQLAPLIPSIDWTTLGRRRIMK
ncbi:MAG TPA: mycofactocin biosynthesis glycosyltransferase MftF [Acidimicrobiales bacterium]